MARNINEATIPSIRRREEVRRIAWRVSMSAVE
jgi:hypothetical protein